MKKYPIDPFPAPEESEKNNLWIYGRAEREAFLLQQLIRAKNDARLKVGYPGEFMLPHNTMYFKAEFPAGKFPVSVTGSPAITEINMAAPGTFEFTLSVPDTASDVPCFCCNADVRWYSSADGVNWNSATGVPGGGTPPHKLKLSSINLTPEHLENGIYDTGREIIGWIHIKNAANAGLYVGESIDEALNRDPEAFEQRLDLLPQEDGSLRSAVPLAFRYISLEQAENAEISVEALYTPEKLLKRFSCDDEELNAIWERSVYTLHLCIHHFMIDGVKRDRLPWAGDLAVSLLSMTESFGDAAPIRDTLAVLGSAGIHNAHINGITDYSLWYLINFDLYEKYFNDTAFLHQEYFRIVETAKLLLEKRLANGLLPLDGWVFIDWVPGDKNCALQMLFFSALKALSDLAQKMGDTRRFEQWSSIAGELRRTLLNDFYDPSEGLFACSPGSGEFLRHQNFFAIGTVADEEESRKIAKILLEGKLPHVGTPYMKTFEIAALIRAGFRQEALEEIRRYWGGMVKAGATTFFEAYGEGKNGNTLYDFYDRPFGLSLCHAWGSAPAFLLPMIFKG